VALLGEASIGQGRLLSLAVLLRTLASTRSGNPVQDVAALVA
jgi:hypothetical protein